MNWCSQGPFSIFDIETTGMSPVNDRIVELAAVRVECDGSLRHFSYLVNPGRHIPARATQVHNITDEMVKNAPFFEDIAEEFLDFISGSRLVAHNAIFDLSFIQESFFRGGFPLWDGKTIDTVKLARMTHPGLPSYSLQNLRAHFRLETAPGMNPHRAAADVEWTRQLLGILITAMHKQHNKFSLKG
ncbi:MAG: 3'-5' exonuclease [Lentisphaeria bacterium]|nr:3'-5' exonuclease [Lentisphaeria bacterium]